MLLSPMRVRKKWLPVQYEQEKMVTHYNLDPALECSQIHELQYTYNTRMRKLKNAICVDNNRNLDDLKHKSGKY